MSERQTRFNLLDTIPVCAGDVRTEWEGECAVLILPRFREAWMQRWLLPKSLSPYVRMPLEEHGTAVWRLVDGQRTVREIIELLAPHFEGDTTYPSRVAAYLMRLQKDGLIRLLAGA